VATVALPMKIRAARAVMAKPAAMYASRWSCCGGWFICWNRGMPAKTIGPTASAKTIICTLRTTRRANSSELKGDIGPSLLIGVENRFRGDLHLIDDAHYGGV